MTKAGMPESAYCLKTQPGETYPKSDLFNKDWCTIIHSDIEATRLSLKTCLGQLS
jgi:hypothetical protein